MRSMARSIRIEYEGAFYHVMARGNRRGEVFEDERDCEVFLEALGEACGMTGWRVHAWVLMGNHYHLMVETPEANLVAGMKWLQNAVTRRLNVRHGQWGRVFGDRYKAVLVEGGERYYYETLVDYVHLNPVRAGMVRPSAGESLLDYEWSSLSRGYAVEPGRRAKWQAGASGLAVFGFEDTVAGRRAMVERTERRAVEEEGELCGVPLLPEEVDVRCSHLRRGWYWGTREFAERARELVRMEDPRSRIYRSSAEYRSHGLDQAERWLGEGLAAAGMGAAELKRRRGSDAVKVALADLLWRRTVVSQGWIAERLAMKSAANVSQILRTVDRSVIGGAIPAGLRRFLEECEGTGRSGRGGDRFKTYSRFDT